MIIREDIRNGLAEPSWPLIEALLFPQSEQTAPRAPRLSAPTTPTRSPPTYAEAVKIPQLSPSVKRTAPNGKIVPLMSVVFPPEKLTQLHSWYGRVHNISIPRGKYPHLMRASIVKHPKRYSVQLTLAQLIKFWSVFPEWIPSLSHCPLVNPQSFLLMPQNVYHQ